MEHKVVSFKAATYEKMYRNYFNDINNYNRSLMMVGTAPKNTVEFKQVKTG